LSRKLERSLTLDDIPDTDLDRLADLGFDSVWSRSVWQTAPAGQQVSRSHPEWRKEFGDREAPLNSPAAVEGLPVDSMKAGEPFGGHTCVGDPLVPLRRYRQTVANTGSGKKAIVAMARRLGVLLWRLSVRGEPYRAVA
jgi:hypothetical protein